MPNEEWGVKRLCPTTGKRFYDLGRTPIVSPYTGEVVAFDANNKSHVVIETKKPKEEDQTDENEDLLDDDDTSDVELDDDLLDDDEEEDTVPLDELADVAANDDNE
ncbi:TIGR02300 family protein [Candidatus Halocynthiibacter alkanivorans]|jgi:uncharacterized protein (TIGR02300 family)|uniref:TIGR02300 family protein n=1 Tax=Candidatus Halocynthiibacter alkanivorans TaxID=2267619 RepID=UPI000DF1AFDF|nr:TIGR02300 family protein [Candidatus Halocynthiibacter alkanivorans]